MIGKFLKNILKICGITAVLIIIGFIVYSMNQGNSSAPAPPVSEGISILKYPENQTAFKFMTAGGVTIITDPFFMDEDVAATIVTESHQHIDHTDTSRITGDYSLLKTSGNYTIDGVHIVGYPGKHDKGDQPGTNIIFVFDIDGIRIAQFASQGDVPDEATLAKIADVDILIIQFMNYATKMTPEEAAAVAAGLHAKIIIPAHGDPSMNGTFADLMGIELQTVDSGSMLVTRESLDAMADPVVFVLDH